MKILVSTNIFENTNKDEDGFILGDEKPKWNFAGKTEFYFDLNDQDEDIRTYADFDVECAIIRILGKISNHGEKFIYLKHFVIEGRPTKIEGLFDELKKR